MPKHTSSSSSSSPSLEAVAGYQNRNVLQSVSCSDSTAALRPITSLHVFCFINTSDVNKARPLKAKAKATFLRPSHNAKACDKR